jgi:uncharacterized protein (UPF0128 family)
MRKAYNSLYYKRNKDKILQKLTSNCTLNSISASTLQIKYAMKNNVYSIPLPQKMYPKMLG